MEWNLFNAHPPYDGQWVAAYRKPWPSYYWMGQYQERDREDEDLFDYWIEIPPMERREDE